MLRVQKVRRKKSAAKGVVREPGAPVLTAHERILWKDVDKIGECTSKDIAGQLYALHVMSPLLGPEHVDPGVCMQLPNVLLVLLLCPYFFFHVLFALSACLLQLMASFQRLK